MCGRSLSIYFCTTSVVLSRVKDTFIYKETKTMFCGNPSPECTRVVVQCTAYLQL